MKTGDAVIGAIVLATGVTIVAGASSLPPMIGQIVGPGLFPTAIGACMVACSLPLLARGLLAPRAGPRREPGPDAVGTPPSDAAVPVRDRDSRWAVPVILGGLALYLPLLDLVGFRVLTVLYMVAVIRAAGGSLPGAMLFGTAATLAVDYGFTRGLGVPLPAGGLPLVGG